MTRRKTPNAHALLHRLWTKAVGTDGYIKQEWKDLEAFIAQFNRRRRERRTAQR